MQQQGSNTEVRQDYLKIILDTAGNKPDEAKFISNKEIADMFHVKPPSVTSIISKLQKTGLVEWKKRKGARLTSKGTALARQINEMHQIVDAFLVNVLNATDEKFRERVACKMEHILLDEPSLAKILKSSTRQARSRNEGMKEGNETANGS